MQLRTPFLVWRGYTPPHTTPHFWSTATPLAFFVKLVFCRHLITLLKIDIFCEFAFYSCTGSRWSLGCASKTDSWERTELVCCLPSESWSTLCQTDLRYWRLILPAPPFRNTTTRTSSPSTSSASRLKIWRTKWGDWFFHNASIQKHWSAENCVALRQTR